MSANQGCHTVTMPELAIKLLSACAFFPLDLLVTWSRNRCNTSMGFLSCLNSACEGLVSLNPSLQDGFLKALGRKDARFALGHSQVLS